MILSTLGSRKCLLSSVRTFASVKHVVMFRFKPGTSTSDVEKIHKGLLSLPKQIPEIKAYELGVDLLLPSGQNHPAGPNRQVSWTATFDNVEDYQTYNDSDEHKEFLGNLKDLVEPGSRAAIQYEVPESS